MRERDGTYRGLSRDQYPDGERLSKLAWSLSPKVNGLIRAVGFYDVLNGDVDLNGTPFESPVNGYGSRFAINVRGAEKYPFKIRVTGAAIDERTGLVDLNAEEIAEIEGEGFHQFKNMWVDKPMFQQIDTDAHTTMVVANTSYWDNSGYDFNLDGVQLDWVPSHEKWSIELKVVHVRSSGHGQVIDETKFTSDDDIVRAERMKMGRHKRKNYDRRVLASQYEGVVVEIDVFNIREIVLNME